MQIRTLAEAVSQYGREAYLLTIAHDGPHVGQVTIELRGGVIGCLPGPSATKNIAREAHVSLFWPPMEAGGYALIINGTATSERAAAGLVMAEIAVTKAVLHRAGRAAEDAGGPCASDCRRLVWEGAGRP